MRRTRMTWAFWSPLICMMLLVPSGGSSRPFNTGDTAEDQHRTETESDSYSVSDTSDTSPSGSQHWDTVTVIVVVVCNGVVIAVHFNVCKRTEESISNILGTKKKNLARREAQLRKQSIEIQEELDKWGTVLITSKDLLTGLQNQREEFRLQLAEIEREREENKEKVHLVEKEIAASEREKATDKTEGYLREKQSLLDSQWKLEKRKEEVEKHQLNMERLLQKTDVLIKTMTERQSEVKIRKKVIHDQLEEVESSDETTHLHNE